MKKRTWLGLAGAILSVGLVLGSLPRQAVAIDDGNRSEQQAAYRALVARLASDEFEGRGTGSAGITRARRFIVDHFKSVGLKPGNGQAYTQTFRCPIGGRIRKFYVGFTDSQGRTTRLTKGKDVGPLPLTGSARFKGPVVFVGYGAASKAHNYDSYAGVKKGELKGKVLVMLRYEPHDANGVSLWAKRRSAYGMWTRSAGFTTKMDLARKHEAAAVIIVNPPAHDKNNGPSLPDTVARVGRSRMPILQLSLDRFRRMCKHQGFDFDTLKQRADAGAGRPTPLGATMAGELKIRRASTPCDNLVASLPGAGDLKDQVVIVGAHYDHLGVRQSKGKKQIFHGADDNASGTAGIMTLAERMARYARTSRADRRRIVFVAFAAEERGLIGSRYMVKHLRSLEIDSNAVAAMMNFDMIGRVRNDRLHVWGVDSGKEWRSLIDRAVKRSSLKLSLISSGFGPSDHASFYRAKIPVLGFHSGAHRDLHRPSDTVDKINPEGALRAIALAEDLLRTVATRDDPITYQPPKKRGKGVYLGIAPTRARGGCGVGRVLQGGPADQGGIEPGDVIISIGGRKVTGLTTLPAILRQFKPGQTVLITVRRDDEQRTLNVTLGSR